MSHWLRQTLAIATLFGGGAFMYLWLGVPGAFGYGVGIGAALLSVGLSTGYWIGITEDADILVTKLMQWRKQRLDQ